MILFSLSTHTEVPMPSSTFTTVFPGNPTNWREFHVLEFDPKAQSGSEEDALGQLLEQRTNDDPFGVTVVAEPLDTVPDVLVKRLAGARIPARIERKGRDKANAAQQQKQQPATSGSEGPGPKPDEEEEEETP